MNYSCKEYAIETKKRIKETIENHNLQPKLVVIQIDSNSASSAYVKGKKNDCAEVGIKCVHAVYNSDRCDENHLAEEIFKYGCDNSVHGIIIQLPIPKKYNLERLQNLIPASKDVDGFRKDSFFKSCTPLGIMKWLASNNYDLTGKNAVVIGRSEIVGKPLVNLLIEAGATVTCCNSKTKDINYYLDNADIVFSATGQAKNFEWFQFNKKTEVIVDIGITKDVEGKLCGDIDPFLFEENRPDTYLTPVPGGVGLLTRVALLANVCSSALYHKAKNEYK